jgi:tRNA threonylcarbamoyl adenosine modification protein YjeE
VVALPLSADPERIALPNVEATAALAHRLADGAARGDVFGLSGPLGAGKTTFARAFIGEIARLSGETVDEVPSPTFTLVQTYNFARATVWHFDLYRIGKPAEVWEIGLEAALAEGISLIEWPERLGPLLPAKRIAVALSHGATPEARMAEISAHG